MDAQENSLYLEVSDKFIGESTMVVRFGKAALMFSSPVNEDYWIFRVKLHEDQSIVGFPKYSGVGIGFAQETNWNTNLPYTCDTAMIYDHIKENKCHDEITEEQCIEAIHMVQEAARRYQQSRGLAK